MRAATGHGHRALLELVPSVRRPLSLAVISGLLAAAALIVQTLLLTWVVRDVLFRGERLDEVLPELLLAGVAAAVRAGLVALREYLSRRAALRVEADLRRRLAHHLLRLGPAYVSGERTGELVAVATQGIEKLEPFVSRYLPQTALGVAVPLCIVLAVAPVDWISAGLLLFTVPVIVLLMILIGTFTRDHVQHQWESLSRLGSAFLDVIQGLPTLVLLDRDEAQRSRVVALSEQFRDRTLSVLKVAFLSGAVLELMSAAGIGLIATVLGVRLLDGGIPFDRALYVFLLTPEFYRPIRDLGSHRHAAIEGQAAAARLLEIFETPAIGERSGATTDSAGGPGVPVEEAGQMPDTAPVGVPQHPSHAAQVLAGSRGQQPGIAESTRSIEASGRPAPSRRPLAVDFQNVSYSYPGRSQPALQGLTLSLAPGTRTAVVGPSGSGKSTLVNLLLRAIDPQEGSVQADGVALPAIALDAWREHIALVPQRPHLFRGSVRDNIRLARPEASDEEVALAAELAGCLPFVADLPEGLEATIGERGEGLSAGERQRIAIARAFLKRAPLLVLDEPTSALDPRSEAHIRQALSVLMRDRTVLVVAHRLNTVRDADRVAVLDGGRLVEWGAHEELLRQDGLYARLVGCGVEAVTAR